MAIKISHIVRYLSSVPYVAQQLSTTNSPTCTANQKSIQQATHISVTCQLLLYRKTGLQSTDDSKRYFRQFKPSKKWQQSMLKTVLIQRVEISVNVS